MKLGSQWIRVGGLLCIVWAFSACGGGRTAPSSPPVALPGKVDDSDDENEGDEAAEEDESGGDPRAGAANGGAPQTPVPVLRHPSSGGAPELTFTLQQNASGLYTLYLENPRTHLAENVASDCLSYVEGRLVYFQKERSFWSGWKARFFLKVLNVGSHSPLSSVQARTVSWGYAVSTACSVNGTTGSFELRKGDASQTPKETFTREAILNN